MNILNENSTEKEKANKLNVIRNSSDHNKGEVSLLRRRSFTKDDLKNANKEAKFSPEEMQIHKKKSQKPRIRINNKVNVKFFNSLSPMKELEEQE